LFLVRFWAFLGKGSSKTPQKYFYKNAMSKTFSEKILRKPKKNSISVFPQLFCFIALLGVSWRWEFKSTTKNVLQKNRVEKFFKKIDPKNPKPTFSRFVFITFFGHFSVRGVQKHDKKISKKT
jgi:hypothetical protein